MRVPLLTMLFILILVAVIALAGYGVGAIFDAPGTGPVYALVTLLPLAAFLQKRVWARLAWVLLGLCFIIATELGGWGAGVVVYLAGIIMVTLSATSLSGLYGGDDRQALWQHLKLQLHINEGFHIIDNAVTWGSQEDKDRQFLGPRAVIIRPGMAATLINGGQRTRIVGPSMLTSERWEHVQHIYNLQPLHRDLVLREVLTTDLLPMEIKLAVTFGIDIPAEMRTGAVPLSDQARERLAYIDDNIPGWEHQTEAIIESELRDALAHIRLRRDAHSLGTLYVRPEPDPARSQGAPERSGRSEDSSGPELLDISRLRFENIEHTVAGNTNRRLQPLGIVLQRVTIKNIQPQDEVIAANNQSAIEMIRERGKAEAWGQALGMLADGYKMARDAKLSDKDLHTEVLRRMLELIGRDPSSGMFLPAETMRALSELRRTVD